jgi:hypothetical protein
LQLSLLLTDAIRVVVTAFSAGQLERSRLPRNGVEQRERSNNLHDPGEAVAQFGVVGIAVPALRAAISMNRRRFTAIETF